MDQLSLENLIDLRESTTRRLKDVEDFKPATFEAKSEQNRRKASLIFCLEKIEERIKDLQFEAEQLPFPRGFPIWRIEKTYQVGDKCEFEGVVYYSTIENNIANSPSNGRGWFKDPI